MNEGPEYEGHLATPNDKGFPRREPLRCVCWSMGHFNRIISLQRVVGFFDLKSCLMAFLRPVGSKRPEVERANTSALTFGRDCLRSAESMLTYCWAAKIRKIPDTPKSLRKYYFIPTNRGSHAGSPSLCGGDEFIWGGGDKLLHLRPLFR